MFHSHSKRLHISAFAWAFHLKCDAVIKSVIYSIFCSCVSVIIAAVFFAVHLMYLSNYHRAASTVEISNKVTRVRNLNSLVFGVLKVLNYHYTPHLWSHLKVSTENQSSMITHKTKHKSIECLWSNKLSLINMFGPTTVVVVSQRKCLIWCKSNLFNNSVFFLLALNQSR